MGRNCIVIRVFELLGVSRETVGERVRVPLYAVRTSASGMAGRLRVRLTLQRSAVGHEHVPMARGEFRNAVSLGTRRSVVWGAQFAVLE